jgi:hypothetical protein
MWLPKAEPHYYAKQSGSKIEPRGLIVGARQGGNEGNGPGLRAVLSLIYFGSRQQTLANALARGD